MANFFSGLFGPTPSGAPQQPPTAAQVAGGAVGNAAAAQPGGPLATGVDANNSVPNSTTVGSDGRVGAIPPTAQGEASPLSGYKDMWVKAPDQVTAASIIPDIQADPAKMMAAASQMDFTKVIPTELLDKASKGDAQSLAQMVNLVGQAGFAQAAGATVRIVKGALEQQAKTFEEKYVPSMMRNNDVANEVRSNISLATNPAAAPLVEGLRVQLQSQFPTASPAEITTHINNYLSEFAKVAVEAAGGKIQTKDELTKANARNPMQRADQDWEKFFEMETP